MLGLHPTLSSPGSMEEQNQKTTELHSTRELSPLSSAQERFWVLDQLFPQNPAYNVSRAFRIRGTLDVSALESALNRIIERHEPLRTSFTVQDGKPYQEVHSEILLNITQRDLTGLSRITLESQIQDEITREVQIPFDLGNAPLFRAKLLRTAPDNSVLIVVLHHIVCDGWSLGVLYRELEVLYSKGGSASLPDPRIRYQDIARNPSHDELAESSLIYWKKKLGDDLPLLAIPTDYPRPATPSPSGGRHFVRMPPDLCKGLRDLSKDQGCSLFMTVLAVFQILLYRYSGQDRVIVGCPVDCRTDPDTHGLIGALINLLAFTADLSGNPSFEQFLAQVRKTAFEGYRHHDLPFERLVKELQPERNLSYHPVFQVMLQFSDESELLLPDLTTSPIEFDSGASQFDLSLCLWEGDSSLDGFFEYSRDLFDTSTIHRMTDHLLNLFRGVVDDPGQPISKLSLLSSSAKRQLLVEWNNVATDFGEPLCIHELVAAQMKRTPGSTAVIFGDEQLSYGELDRKSNQLARYLQKKGAGDGALIGVCMDPCLELLVALLGILKAGSAYVPLDPAYPPKRLQFIARDSNIALLLADQEDLLLEQFQTVNLKQNWGEIGKERSANLGTDVKATQTAYVIYTSGSTGTPKGVPVPHSAIANCLLSMLQRPGLREEDVLLSVTSISFDPSVLELFLPLMTGARIVLANRKAVLDASVLSEILLSSDVTVMQATPSAWQLLINRGWKGKKDLKAICGGEGLSAQLAEELLTRTNSLWNVYGTTETTVWSSTAKIEVSERPIPIGKPIANTRFYVLDRYQEPVPIGVPGDLHIAGAGVAPGYLNRPELTAERFIQIDFAGRVYRTGDLVRYLPDGSLVFLGRMDHQVQIRGARVELAEIEAALNTHPNISKTVVSATEGVSGAIQLVAYFKSLRPGRLGSTRLRDYLRNTLPDHMLPSFFVPIDEFPLTPTGKVDRNALPTPQATVLKSKGHRTPLTDLERQLISIWKRVIRAQLIGIDDNFFEIGGDSLLAAQLFAETEKTLGVSVPLATLFQAPTVAELSKLLQDSGWKPGWSPLVPIRVNGEAPPLFLVHGAEGNVLLYRELSDLLGPEQPVYGIQARGLDGKEDIFCRIEDMAAFYLETVQSLQPEGPYYFGGYCMGGLVAYEMAQQLHAQGQDVALLALLETYNPQAELPRYPRLYKICWAFQNVVFHLENLFSVADARFFSEKVRIQRRRFSIWARANFSQISKKLGLRNRDQAYPHLVIKRVNDQAATDYSPKPLPGRIALFKPRKHFAGRKDPCFGWKGLAKKGITICELPVSPRGMLVEPFVRKLAEKLKDTLLRAQNT